MALSEDERFVIDPPQDTAPLGGTREQAMQRLQMGIGGVVAITLLVGLASLIEGRAKLADEDAVPEAMATTEPVEESTRSDPLVEAGVVPDLPATQTPTAQPDAPILPEQGLGENVLEGRDLLEEQDSSAAEEGAQKAP